MNLHLGDSDIFSGLDSGYAFLVRIPKSGIVSFSVDHIRWCGTPIYSITGDVNLNYLVKMVPDFPL